MASQLYYVIFIVTLISLLLVELVHGREISTIKKENNDIIKNVTASSYLQTQNGESHEEGHFLRSTNGLMRPGLLPNDHQLETENAIQHRAVIRWRTDQSFDCTGTKATLNVYGLPEVSVESIDQSSSIAIWVGNGVGGDLDTFDTIVTGWHVYPKLYGDHNTHFFIYWTANKRGCYNLLCEGFIPYKSSKFVPGNRLDPVSIIDGKQFEITLQVSKDSKTGDWWLIAGTNGNEPVGHWPKSLFTSLAESTSILQWGGAVHFFPNQKSPPMGSGRYPREGFGKAAYVKDVQLINGDHSISDFSVKHYEDQTYCYQVDGDGPFYYFGGPGGCTS